MAFESQEYSQKFYHGFTKLRVLGINPNKAQLEEMGFKPKDEPSYESNGKFRTSVYLKDTTTDVIYNYAFFVENEVRKSNDGLKTQWINKLGQSWWGADSTPTQQWQSTEGVRAAMKGEADLVDFVKHWLSAYKECQFTPEEITAISKGDVTCLKAMAINNPNKIVGALVGVQKAEGDKYYNKIGTFCGATSKPEKFSAMFTRFINGSPKYTSEYHFGVMPFELTLVEDPATLPFGTPTDANALMQENEL